MLDVFEGEVEGRRIEGDVIGLFLFGKGDFVGSAECVDRLAHVFIKLYNATETFQKIHQ
jgi:hypothetical protein